MIAKRLLQTLLTIATAATVLAACKHNADNPVPATPSNNTPGDTTNNGGGGGNPGTNTQDTALCFQRDVLPIFIANCAKSGCHDAISRQDGFQFTDYESIIRKEFVKGNANATELFEKITEDDIDKRMPPAPAPALTAQQIGLIRRWINEGAVNRGNCGTLCDTTKFTYSGAVKPVTEQYCRGCHSSTSPSGGVVLDTYAGTKAVADNGRLLGAIKHSVGFKPMPQGGSKLSDCQIRQIEKWIAAGAADN